MSYFNLDHRVSEAAAMDPKGVAWLYDWVTRVPLVRALHRTFLTVALGQDCTSGLGLDLGTGPGYVAVQIAVERPEMQVVGLDLAAHMVRRANRQAVRAGLDGRAVWPQADVHRLPLADHSVQLVVSSFALHHWRDPLAVFDEIARVLAPGGCYCVADVCREVTALQRGFAYASVPVMSLAFGSYWGYGGYYESLRAGYTRDEASALLARSNLPPGQVWLESTWFVPVLMIASEGMHV